MHTYCSVVAVAVHLRIFFFNDLHAMVIVYVKCPIVGVNDAHGHASLIYLPLSHCTGYRWLVTV